jgi:tetratricopeptide (TPR) repeat protein
MRCLVLVLLLGTLLLAPPTMARPRGGGLPAAGAARRGGGRVFQQQTPAQKAAEAYNRGLRVRQQAEDSKDAGERKKLYERAQAEFSKSLGQAQSYEALLGLGEVNLRLGNARSALSNCNLALALQADSESAKACVQDATLKLYGGATAPRPPAPPPAPAPGVPPGSDPPAAPIPPPPEAPAAAPSASPSGPFGAAADPPPP